MLRCGRSPIKDILELNCALPVTGRGVNRRSNFIGIGIFQMLNRKDKLYIEWKKNLLHIIKIVFQLMTTKTSREQRKYTYL